MKVEFAYIGTEGNLHLEVDKELAEMVANIYKEKIRNLVFDGDLESMEEAYELFKSWHYIVQKMHTNPVVTETEAEDDDTEEEKEEQEDNEEVSEADIIITAPMDKPSKTNITYFE